jgi:hypothetical protein
MNSNMFKKFVHAYDCLVADFSSLVLVSAMKQLRLLLTFHFLQLIHNEFVCLWNMILIEEKRLLEEFTFELSNHPIRTNIVLLHELWGEFFAAKTQWVSIVTAI